MRGYCQPTAAHAGRLVCLVAVTMALCPFAPAAAGEERERALLAQLQLELRHFDALVRRAQLEAEPGRPRRFDYAALHVDLREMSRAIKSHLGGGRRHPRVPHPAPQATGSLPTGTGHD